MSARLCEGVYARACLPGIHTCLPGQLACPLHMFAGTWAILLASFRDQKGYEWPSITLSIQSECLRNENHIP